MDRYLFKKTIKELTFSDQSNVIRAKVFFKTKEANWLGTLDPIVIPISIHSAFHNKIEGDLKMDAMMSTIKNHVKGKITILLTEKAHLHVLGLKYPNNALEQSLKDARDLVFRYRSCFEGCEIVYWQSLICDDPHYLASQAAVRNLYQKDPIFRECLLADAESCYTEKWKQECPNKTLFLEKTMEDILEHCISSIVLTKKGYRFIFYPGNPYPAMNYVSILTPETRWIEFVPVSLLLIIREIEKKQDNEIAINTL